MSAFVQQLRVDARRTPDRVAMNVGDASLTCAELEQASEERAVSLRSDGVTRGARVLVSVDDVVERCLSVLALIKLGAVPVVLSSGGSLAACVTEVRPRFALVSWRAWWKRWWLASRVEQVFVAGEVAFDDAPIELSGLNDDDSVFISFGTEPSLVQVSAGYRWWHFAR